MKLVVADKLEIITPYWISITKKQCFRRIHTRQCKIRPTTQYCWEPALNLTDASYDALCKISLSEGAQVENSSVSSGDETSSSSQPTCLMSDETLPEPAEVCSDSSEETKSEVQPQGVVDANRCEADCSMSECSSIS